MSENCLLKGTLIELENDKKIEIEKLKVGEKLLSYSINGIIESIPIYGDNVTESKPK